MWKFIYVCKVKSQIKQHILHEIIDVYFRFLQIVHCRSRPTNHVVEKATWQSRDRCWFLGQQYNSKTSELFSIYYVLFLYTIFLDVDKQPRSVRVGGRWRESYFLEVWSQPPSVMAAYSVLLSASFPQNSCVTVWRHTRSDVRLPSGTWKRNMLSDIFETYKLAS